MERPTNGCSTLFVQRTVFVATLGFEPLIVSKFGDAIKDVQKAELFARNQYVEVKFEKQQRKKERDTKLNSGSEPQEKVEGTRGQSTTREAPMGSIKRERWQYIRDYLDRIHIIHLGASR